jgi:hypothetical protein
VTARRHQARALAQVAAVRALQRERAAGLHGETDREVRRLRERTEQAAAAVEDEQRQWTGLLAQPSLDLTLAGLCARTLLSRQDALERAAADSEAGADRLQRSLQAMNRATAEADVAEAVARTAERRERRAIEEAALAAAEERFGREAGR